MLLSFLKTVTHHGVGFGVRQLFQGHPHPYMSPLTRSSESQCNKLISLSDWAWVESLG